MSTIELGKGTYGNVTCQEGEDFVIKTFTEGNEYDYIFYKELFCLSLFKDTKGICQIIDYDMEKKQIKMKKYDMDLAKLMLTISFVKRLALVDDIISQVLTSLRELHSRGITHSDLTLRNIFCNYDAENNKVDCFLGDFSISCIISPYMQGIGNNDYPNNLENFNIKRNEQTKFDIWCLWVAMYAFLFKTYDLPRKYSKEEREIKKMLGPLSCSSLSKRFGHKLTNPLCSNYGDIYNKLRQDLPNNFAYFMEGTLCYYHNNIDMRKDSLEEYDLIKIFGSFKEDITFPLLDSPIRFDDKEYLEKRRLWEEKAERKRIEKERLASEWNEKVRQEKERKRLEANMPEEEKRLSKIENVKNIIPIQKDDDLFSITEPITKTKVVKMLNNYLNKHTTILSKYEKLDYAYLAFKKVQEINGLEIIDGKSFTNTYALKYKTFFIDKHEDEYLNVYIEKNYKDLIKPIECYYLDKLSS